MYEAVVQLVVNSVKTAHTAWKQSAQFHGLLINAPGAVAGPGCFGPEIGGILNAEIQRQLPRAKDNQGRPFDADHNALAVAGGRGTGGNFDKWVHAVTVPNLPLFPVLMSIPGPISPVVMSIPTPLSQFQAGGTATGLTNLWLLQNAMTVAVDAQVKARVGMPALNNLYSAIAGQLANYFTTWLSTQLVHHIQAMGPVPSYSPTSPVGPVVGGHQIPGAPNLL